MAAESTGYKIVHPDGTVEFTDDATRGGEEIKLRGVQAVGAPIDEGKTERRPIKKQAPETKKASGYSSLSILSPRSEETVWFVDTGILVSVSPTPPLSPEDTVVIELDGIVAARGKSTSLNVGLVYRGTHTVSARIIDAGGKTIISSPPVTFFLKQRSN